MELAWRLSWSLLRINDGIKIKKKFLMDSEDGVESFINANSLSREIGKMEK